ncbi:MAG: V/A-type H+-transporting ATPase subunit D [Paraglaciecola sp.]
MARLQLNKSALANEAKSLGTYRRFLPSLDLKRQQLLAERNKAKKIVKQTRNRIDELVLEVSDALPMLANEDINLSGIVRLREANFGTENLVGTRLPVLSGIELDVKPYSLMALPHWVDNVVEMLKEMLELKTLLKVNERRLSLLDAAVKTIAQRVNLFDKVLIPQTEANIKRIKIYLSDEQMASVVRSKIAKRKRQDGGRT